MARKFNRGQSAVEAAIILAAFAAIILAMDTLFSQRARDFDRAVLSKPVR